MEQQSNPLKRGRLAMFFSQAALQKSLEYACGQQSASQHLISRNRRQSSGTGLMSAGQQSGDLSSFRHHRRQLDSADSIDSCSLNGTSCDVATSNTPLAQHSSNLLPAQAQAQAPSQNQAQLYSLTSTSTSTSLAQSQTQVAAHLANNDYNRSSSNVYSATTTTRAKVTNRSVSCNKNLKSYDQIVRGPQQISVLKSASNNYELQYEHLTDCMATKTGTTNTFSRQQIDRHQIKSSMEGSEKDYTKNIASEYGSSKKTAVAATTDKDNVLPPDNSWRQVPLFGENTNEFAALGAAASQYADTNNGSPARFKSRDLSYADDGIRLVVEVNDRT